MAIACPAAIELTGTALSEHARGYEIAQSCILNRAHQAVLKVGCPRANRIMSKVRFEKADAHQTKHAPTVAPIC